MELDPVLTYWLIWMVKLLCGMIAIKIGYYTAVIVVEIRRAFKERGHTHDLSSILNALQGQQEIRAHTVKGSDLSN